MKHRRKDGVIARGDSEFQKVCNTGSITVYLHADETNPVEEGNE